MAAKSKHPLYPTWCNMLSRCYKPSHQKYHCYGERGISVCDRWINSFWDFVSDVGDKPTPQHSIDRYPNRDGNYEPGNVRWATQAEQTRNTRRNTILTVDGQSETIMDWAAIKSISHAAIVFRKKKGWSDHDAVSIPPKPKAENNTLTPVGAMRKCKEAGISFRTVSSRMRRGLTFEEAISMPITPPNSPRKKSP